MNRDLSKGSVVKSMLLFAIPMILGDLLQQCYNIADTLIVGHFLGRKGACSGRLLIYAYDVYNVHSSGPVHGKRCVVFYPVWPAGRKWTERGYLRLVFLYCCCDGITEYDCLREP